MEHDRPDMDDLPHTNWTCEKCKAVNSCLDGECQFCDDFAEPFDAAAHDHLTSIGYSHEHYGESWEDDSWDNTSDAEKGPDMFGGPAYDIYTCPDEYIVVWDNGRVDLEVRDLAFEEYVDERHRSSVIEA
jgi:hypothetical protein